MPRRSAWVYTDGACSGNGYKGARAGVGVYWGNQGPENISNRLYGTQTNSRAELGAVIIALRQAEEANFDKITVHTDSEFITDSMKFYVRKWQNNGWRKSNGKPVVNQDDFQCILELMDRIQVDFRKVNAHSGNYGNDEADRLAREGCKMNWNEYSYYDHNSECEDDDSSYSY